MSARSLWSTKCRKEAGRICTQPEARGSGLSAARFVTRFQGLEPVGKGHAAAGFRAVVAPSGVDAIEDAVVVDPAVAACFGAALLADFRFAFFLAAFLAGFLSDFLFAFRPAALFFFFFFAAFFAFLFLAIVTSVESYEAEALRPPIGHGLFNRRESP